MRARLRISLLYMLLAQKLQHKHRLAAPYLGSLQWENNPSLFYLCWFKHVCVASV